jgi:hypothetical protein
LKEFLESLDSIKFCLTRFKSHLSQIPGFRTKQKLVVFESDDWGAIRMPDKYTFDKLMKLGIRVDRCAYNRFDSLERVEDVSNLAEVLSSVKDSKGNAAVFTLNFLTANPDFMKLKDAGFDDYHYESILDTYKRRDGDLRTFSGLKNGIQSGFFYPQLHGREHLDIYRWMSQLKDPNSVYRKVFDFGIWGLGPKVIPSLGFNLQAALSSADENARSLQDTALKEGLDQFKQLFGMCSKTFIPTNFVLPNCFETILYSKGVRGLQGQRAQMLDNGKSRFRYMGQRTADGHINLVRNVSFELSESPETVSVESCIKEIDLAFKWHKPAVISTHRLNYIGGIVPQNSASNLKELKRLLDQTVKRWPEIEFIHSEELLNRIRQRDEPN